MAVNAFPLEIYQETMTSADIFVPEGRMGANEYSILGSKSGIKTYLTQGASEQRPESITPL